MRYKARMIADMLHDDVNRFYFIFASPVVSEFEQLNAMFQATDADPEKLVRDLYLHESSLRRRVYRENTPHISLKLNLEQNLTWKWPISSSSIRAKVTRQSK